MRMHKYRIVVSTMDDLLNLDEEIFNGALDNFTRASKSVEWRAKVRLTILKSTVLNTDYEPIGEAYDYNWGSDSCYGIPVGSIKMLVLTR